MPTRRRQTLRERLGLAVARRHGHAARAIEIAPRVVERHGLQPLASPQSFFCPYDANPSERDGKLVMTKVVGGILATK